MVCLSKCGHHFDDNISQFCMVVEVSGTIGMVKGGLKVIFFNGHPLRMASEKASKVLKWYRHYWVIDCAFKSGCHVRYVMKVYVFFISIVFFNLRLDYPEVFYKSSLKICLKYAYLRPFKRANNIIWRTSGGDRVVREYQNEEPFQICTF